MRGTHAQAVNDRWAYKISAGDLHAPTRSRGPVGDVPNGSRTTPRTRRTTNTGTTQPKFDARVDYDFAGRRRASCQFSGGVGGTDGIMHTGIGPFDIDSGTTMSYGKVELHARRRSSCRRS